MQRNSLNTGLPMWACRECATPVPRDGDDICEGCATKLANQDQVRYIIGILEKGATAARLGDLSSLRCALRDARHECQDFERSLS